MSTPTAAPIGPNELAALKRHVDHGLVSSGTRQTLASLIALLESQRATIERQAAEKAGLVQELAETRSALKPFADFCEQAERFVSARAADGRTAIFPTKHFRLEHFRRAQALSRSTEVNDER